MVHRVRRALLSVSDKSGILEFATGLADLGVELVSTGGTANELRSAGLPVRGIEELTGFPEMLDGRVKTLHPAVHGGILFRRELEEHQRAVTEHGISPIDIVCVNLYPFAETVRSGKPVQECIENIDIGGPSMVRSAAKNHEHVVVLVDPSDYAGVLEELRTQQGAVPLATRRRLAAKAFAHVAAYDARIAEWMRTTLAPGDEHPQTLVIGATLAYPCRYGENPHQKAAFYVQDTTTEPCIGLAKVIHGKPLSFNNLCDADAALETIKDFSEAPACVIVKHTNPCGLAQAPTLDAAFRGALEGDPVSAFGGIVALSQVVDRETARAMTEPGTFFEVIIAPGYDAEALELLKSRRKWGENVRLLEVGSLESWRSRARGWQVKQLVGGLLVQDRDLKLLTRDEITVVTERRPTEDELQELLFAWRAVKHVKSNAIVLTKEHRIVGVGAGQMNRVQSVRLAVAQAGEKAAGSVLASDAFFPFADGPTVAADAGVTAIIQPGGSRRDSDTIALCNERGVAMVFTGVRHFRH